MRILVFLLLFPFNSIAQDALLEAMFKDWNEAQDEEIESNVLDDDSEAEIYHWNLGTPDNIPATEIIYTDENPCQL
jgi:hypothetical protein